MRKNALLCLLMVLLMNAVLLAQSTTASTPLIVATPTVTIQGLDGKEVVFTLDQLKQMPQQSVSVMNPHTKAKENYEGVLLSDVLAKLSTPSGDKLRGEEMADYVEVMGGDRYRVVFALAELDPAFQDSKVLLAISSDGKPLSPTVGPIRLVATQDKRPARSVRMVAAIAIRRAPPISPSGS